MQPRVVKGKKNKLCSHQVPHSCVHITSHQQHLGQAHVTYERNWRMAERPFRTPGGLPSAGGGGSRTLLDSREHYAPLNCILPPRHNEHCAAGRIACAVGQQAIPCYLTLAAATGLTSQAAGHTDRQGHWSLGASSLRGSRSCTTDPLPGCRSVMEDPNKQQGARGQA